MEFKPGRYVRNALYFPLNKGTGDWNVNDTLLGEELLTLLTFGQRRQLAEVMDKPFMQFGEAVLLPVKFLDKQDRFYIRDLQIMA